MKKRIIAFILAFVISSAAIAETYRPARAELTAAAVITIGVAAWKIIGAMTGDNPQAMDAVKWCIQTNIDSAENFFDACVNPDSEFQTRWKSGFTQMCNTLSTWFESGDITIDGDKLKLSYSQYLELINQCVGRVAKPDISFEAGFNYYFLSGDLSKPFSPLNLPLLDEFYSDIYNGEAYAPVYYSKDKLIFPSTFFRLRNFSSYIDGRKTSYEMSLKKFTSKEQAIDIIYHCPQPYDTLADACAVSRYSFSFVLNYSYCTFNHLDVDFFVDSNLDYCFLYENGFLSYVPITDVDITGMNSGLITTTGDYASFINSIRGYTITDNPVEIDDLSDVIPDGENPHIVVNTDPDVPIPDAVIIDDVPLSDYKTNLDIDIPSIIIDKFPFCVPFDFVRILSVLAAEPKAPVFRIPISTNMDNISPFEGNQTIGNVPEDFEPMFEIDEEIVLDLSTIPLIQPISYTIFIIGFVIMLIILTPKMINH